MITKAYTLELEDKTTIIVTVDSEVSLIDVFKWVRETYNSRVNAASYKYVAKHFTVNGAE
jgi:hypothetical protein